LRGATGPLLRRLRRSVGGCPFAATSSRRHAPIPRAHPAQGDPRRRGL